jgi:hypothetical protein
MQVNIKNNCVKNRSRYIQEAPPGALRFYSPVGIPVYNKKLP